MAEEAARPPLQRAQEHLASAAAAVDEAAGSTHPALARYRDALALVQADVHHVLGRVATLRRMLNLSAATPAAPAPARPNPRGPHGRSR
jgi:hypothetical protein